MTTRSANATVIALSLALIGVLAVYLLLVFLGITDAHVSASIASPEPMQVVSLKDTPIAIYDPRERALTVTAHAPRETLICLRGDCRLVEAWLGK